MANWARGLVTLILVFALGGLLVAGCSGGGGSAEGGSANPGGSSGRLVLDLSIVDGPSRLVRTSGDQVQLLVSPTTQTLVVRLLQDSSAVVERSFVIDSTTRQIIVPELPVGTFQLQILLLNSEGQIQARFSTTVTLSPGQVTIVTATLSPSPSPSATVLPTTPRIVYVADQGGGTITAVRFLNGSLSGVTGSPFALGGDPYTLAFKPGLNFLFAGLFNSNEVKSFQVDTSTGALTLLDADSALTPGVVNSVALHPTLQVLYAGLPSLQQKVQWFTYDGLGSMTAAGSNADSPFGTSDVDVDPSGNFAYGTGNNTIATYSVDANGNLTGVLGNHALGGGSGIQSLLVQGTGPLLIYTTVAITSPTIAKHEINAGTLVADQTVAMLPSSGTPGGLDVHPSASHLYVASNTHIMVYDLAADGTMTLNEAEAVAGAGVRDVVVDPSGNHLLALQSFGPSVPGALLIYQIGTGGELTFVSSSQVGNNPTDLHLVAP